MWMKRLFGRFLSFPQHSSTQTTILKLCACVTRINPTALIIFFFCCWRKQQINDKYKNTFREEKHRGGGGGGGKRRIDCENQERRGPVRLLGVSLYASLERQCAWSCVPLPQNKNTLCCEFPCLLVLLRVATSNILGRIIPEATTWIKLCIWEHAGAYHSEWAREHPPHYWSRLAGKRSCRCSCHQRALMKTRRTGFAVYRPALASLYQHFHFVHCVISDASVPWLGEIQRLGQRNALGHMT